MTINLGEAVNTASQCGFAFPKLWVVNIPLYTSKSSDFVSADGSLLLNKAYV